MKSGTLKIQITLLSLILVSLSASAQVAPILGQPAYGGSGCPAGSASLIAAAGGQGLSILFDPSTVESGSNGKSLDRRSCNLAIPVQVPSGYQLAFQPVAETVVATSAAGALTLQIDTFLAGTRGASVKKQFKNYSGHPLIAVPVVAGKTVWTTCGQSTNLRINSSLLAIGNSALGQMLSLNLKFALRQCQ